jgi:ribosomal protein L32E
MSQGEHQSGGECHRHHRDRRCRHRAWRRKTGRDQAARAHARGGVHAPDTVEVVVGVVHAELERDRDQQRKQ